jgi:mRNA-degrading endonuclease RelE of RelBE toxin-antitoxin system
LNAPGAKAHQRSLGAMPKREQGQLAGCLEAIAAAPATSHANGIAKKGEAAGRLRVRQGDWRAIFTIEGGDVEMIRIAHRSEVYD